MHDVEHVVTGEGAASELHVGIMGALTISHGRTAKPLATVKTRHLLRLLAIQAGTPVRTSRLIDVLWPDAPEERGRASLRTATSVLRGWLGNHRVVRIADTIVLRDVTVDAVEFRRLATHAMARLAEGRDPEALTVVDRALAQYRGHLAEDEPYLEPLLDAQEQLRLLRDELLVSAAERCLALGRPADAVRFASSIAAEDASSERACRLLIHSYGQLDEASMALRSYHRCTAALAREFGLIPSEATRKLASGVVEQAGRRTRDERSTPLKVVAAAT